MKYVKNTDMEFLDLDSETLVIYDPQTEDTHYISETGKAILSLLDEARELDALVGELCEIYAAEKHEIESDVREFLDELVAKKAVLVL